MEHPSTIPLTEVRPDSNSSESGLPATHSSSQDALTDLLPITRKRQIRVLISGFLTICITIGFNQSYSVFQNYYISPGQDILHGSTASQSAVVAFVGTLGAGLTWSGSILVNPLMARLGVRGTRALGILGALLMSMGFALASLSTRVWQLLLTQGLLYGLGSSLLYFPILSAAPESFTAHRASAMGIILSGAGVGGLVLSPLIRALLSACGPRWTLRVLALLTLAVALPAALIAPPSRLGARRPTHVGRTLAQKPAFVLAAVAGFLQSGGNGLPATFLAEYSVVVGYSVGTAATLVAVSSGVNAAGRLVAGWAGDRWGRQNVLVVTVVGCVVAVVGLWMGSVREGGMVLWVVFVVFYAIVGGGYNALFPTTIVDVFGIQAYASVNGFMYFVRGLGTMVGSPVGGQILGESKLGNYRNVVWFDAALLGGAALCVIGVRWWDAVEKKAWKWRA